MGGHVPAGTARMVAQALSAQPEPAMRVNFCAVWMGDKYGPEYPTILIDSILRNASTLEPECAFWLITDRQDEAPEGFNVIAPDPRYSAWWTKCQLFSRDMPWRVGDRCVYFDLDVAITGQLEDLVEREGIIQDWHWPCFNSSVMVWTHGEHSEIWDSLTPERTMRPAGPDLAPLLPAGEINGGDQEHITELGGWQTFPREWFASYRDARNWPPDHCKAVIFHGAPKPHEITDGWVPKIWAVGGLTSFPPVKGANTSHEARMANVRVNVLRDLPWFTGFRDEGRTCAIVCGAPSMRDCLDDIKAQKRRGVRIVTVNNAWRFLVENGVMPDVHVMVDARPDNVAFIADAPKSMRYLIASHCHPDVFDALADREVVIWHSGSDAGSNEIWEFLKPYREGPNQKPTILVPGGSTVGLRCLWLATFSGFRTIHVYGMDSSFASDGSHHAYAQPLNDPDQALEVMRGETKYLCARWMIRQAQEFGETWRDLRNYADLDGKPAPVTIHVHGKGLIPDIARDLRREAMAA